MLYLRTRSRRREALRPSGSARCGESGARSNAALRVWDGPSGFLWRESREKPDSDSDYGFCRTVLGAYGRYCLLRCGIHAADVRQARASGALSALKGTTLRLSNAQSKTIRDDAPTSARRETWKRDTLGLAAALTMPVAPGGTVMSK